MADVGGCRLTGASFVPGPADTVPTEGESLSWRPSVGRWGLWGGGEGAGRTARWISGPAAPSRSSCVNRHFHIHTDAVGIPRKEPVAHYLPKGAYRSDKLLQVAPSTEAEGDSAGFHPASCRRCGEGPVCGLMSSLEDGSAAIKLLCLAVNLPPGLLRKATNEDVTGGEAMAVRARQIWAKRLNSVDDVLPLWINIAEFANQACIEACGGLCGRWSRLMWT